MDGVVGRRDGGGEGAGRWLAGLLGRKWQVGRRTLIVVAVS